MSPCVWLLFLLFILFVYCSVDWYLRSTVTAASHSVLLNSFYTLCNEVKGGILEFTVSKCQSVPVSGVLYPNLV